MLAYISACTLALYCVPRASASTCAVWRTRVNDQEVIRVRVHAQCLLCRLNFSLLRSAITCIRGSRSAHHRPAGPPITTNTMDLACSEGWVQGSSQENMELCKLQSTTIQYMLCNKKKRQKRWTVYNEPATS